MALTTGVHSTSVYNTLSRAIAGTEGIAQFLNSVESDVSHRRLAVEAEAPPLTCGVEVLPPTVRSSLSSLISMVLLIIFGFYCYRVIRWCRVIRRSPGFQTPRDNYRLMLREE